jgi:hypothetical protein
MTYQLKYVQTLGAKQKGFEFAFDQYKGGSIGQSYELIIGV